MGHHTKHPVMKKDAIISVEDGIILNLIDCLSISNFILGRPKCCTRFNTQESDGFHVGHVAACLYIGKENAHSMSP